MALLVINLVSCFSTDHKTATKQIFPNFSLDEKITLYQCPQPSKMLDITFNVESFASVFMMLDFLE